MGEARDLNFDHSFALNMPWLPQEALIPQDNRKIN